MGSFLQAVRYENDVCFISFFVLWTLLPSGKACGQSEYKSPAGECCPMCNIGSVVLKDCIHDLSTTCKPCPSGTFMSEPNGLHNCFTCRNCVKSQGLYILSKCTTIQDTTCDILDGYYCIDYSNSQCSHAQKHSVCKSGQETKTPGTKTTNAVCSDCPHGFYSPSGLNCTKWTECSARNEIETEHGSSVKDAICTPIRRKRHGLLFAIVLITFLCISLYFAPKITSCKLKNPVQETNPGYTAQPTNNTTKENSEQQIVSQESVTPPAGTLATLSS
ncbi:tumor necrosis factor receptor superfamily member 14-like [Puntigrus tetrazona]|uniref:tumor necrosis factor receptor superfamily member 14-like n=1 Tax=Puntigrus tetrazona TaxID=1606681 RepID=UPI001C8AB9DF|nr:tumor necrosis factor receptor superfamily member 14-like [Puntigrus tetrazona]